MSSSFWRWDWNRSHRASIAFGQRTWWFSWSRNEDSCVRKMASAKDMPRRSRGSPADAVLASSGRNEESVNDK